MSPSGPPQRGSRVPSCEFACACRVVSCVRACEAVCARECVCVRECESKCEFECESDCQSECESACESCVPRPGAPLVPAVSPLWLSDFLEESSAPPCVPRPAPRRVLNYVLVLNIAIRTVPNVVSAISMGMRYGAAVGVAWSPPPKNTRWGFQSAFGCAIRVPSRLVRDRDRARSPPGGSPNQKIQLAFKFRNSEIVSKLQRWGNSEMVFRWNTSIRQLETRWGSRSRY